MVWKFQINCVCIIAPVQKSLKPAFSWQHLLEKNIDKSLKGKCNYLWNRILAPPCSSTNSVGLPIKHFWGLFICCPPVVTRCNTFKPPLGHPRRAVMHGSLFKYFCLFWCLWSKLLHWHMAKKWTERSVIAGYHTRQRGARKTWERGREREEPLIIISRGGSQWYDQEVVSDWVKASITIIQELTRYLDTSEEKGYFNINYCLFLGS